MQATFLVICLQETKKCLSLHQKLLNLYDYEENDITRHCELLE